MGVHMSAFEPKIVSMTSTRPIGVGVGIGVAIVIGKRKAAGISNPIATPILTSDFLILASVLTMVFVANERQSDYIEGGRFTPCEVAKWG
jgi:hypothetical protein